MSNPAVCDKTWRLENIHTEPQEELRLIHAGFVRKLSDWKVVSSIQNFWVLWYNFAPGAVCVSGEKTYELVPDKIILIPPRTLYSGSQKFPAPHLFVWFQANFPFNMPESRILEIPAEPYRKQLEQATWLNSRTGFLLKNLAGRLLLDIPESFFQQHDSRNSKAIEKAISFIVKKSGVVSNTEIARHLNISESRFLHLFKDELGMSPQRYCLQVRMSNVEKLLLQGVTIKQAAESGGFADRFHFSKEFKKYHGLPPVKWLKQFEKLLAD